MCEYCEGSKELFYKGRWYLCVENSSIYIEVEYGEYVLIQHVDVNYCPMCGRKLEKE
jgi:hypothetical protein